MTLEPPRGYVQIGDRLKLAPPVRLRSGWHLATCPYCPWQTETMTSPGARFVRWMHRKRAHR